MKNFIEQGDNMTFTAPYALVSGQGALVGTIFGVASADAANGAPFVSVTRGVFSLTKLAGEAWAEGAKVYWDNTNRRCTTTASGNTLIGTAGTGGALSAAVVGPVRLGIVV